MSSLPCNEIDGSMMEGGGQILRNSVTLSCLLKQPITVHNIRGNRSKPGLKAQHLKGLELMSEISEGSLEGGEINSTAISFKPTSIHGGEYTSDVKTAGSVCLLVQVSLPCLMFATKPSKLHLIGGTNADMAPSIDYYEMVYKKVAEKFGLHWTCNVVRRGFFPKGGGEVNINIDPVVELQPITMLDLGEVTKISGLAYVAGMLNANVAQRMATAAKSVLRHIDVKIDINTVSEDPKTAVGTGCGIIVVAETSTGCILGASAIGKKGKSHEDVGKEAANSLLADLEAKSCVDSYMQDQIILLMALARGTSKVLCGPLTLHSKTAIFISEKLTKAKFEVREVENSTNVIVTCEGINYRVEK